MRDPFTSTPKRRRRLRAIDIDAWLDSFLYESGHGLSLWFEDVIVFFRRFHVTGFRRWINELVSEGLTLAAAVGFLAAAFAVPAFEETARDWRAQHEFAVTFLDRHGNEIGKRGILHTDQVELENMPDHLIKAVLATEDRRFFHHIGIDVIGLIRALVENARAGEIVQGGSSITQQLAKNLFLSNERTLERKIKEAYLALWLEVNLTKREILKLYFDRAYMGGGAFGVAAAAEFYFGKSVRDLTLSESAMLAGLFKAPARYAPHVNLPAARARANEVLTNMVQADFLTEGQVVGARLHPAKAISRDIGASPNYFLDWVFEETKKRVSGEERILIVRTTVDMHLQKAAEAAVESSLRESGENYEVAQAGLVAMEPDGTVRAMVGGRDYGASTFNRAVNAKRQPGSSFKAFVYAAAMEDGYTPDSTIEDAPVRIGNWAPQNYNRSYRGTVTLRLALTKSINSVPVRLSIGLGREAIAAMAERVGVETPVRATRSVALGTSEVTVMDLARAYSAFANGGYRAEVTGIVSISTAEGEQLYHEDADKNPLRRVLAPETVASMVDMLHSVVENGTGRRARLPGIPAAGKTGTTQSYRDAWFVGFTGNYTAAVWFGNDNFSGTNRLTGGRLPAEAWQKFMKAAHVNALVKPIPELVYPDDMIIGLQLGQDEIADDPFALPRQNQLSQSSEQNLGRLTDRFRSAAKPRAKVSASEAGNTLVTN